MIEAVPHLMFEWKLSPLSISMNSPRNLETSVSIFFAGSVVSPASMTSASTSVSMRISRSVPVSLSLPSAASKRILESTGSVLRLFTILLTLCRAFSMVSFAILIFIWGRPPIWNGSDSGFRFELLNWFLKKKESRFGFCIRSRGCRQCQQPSFPASNTFFRTC